jgi:hypothetical protein
MKYVHFTDNEGARQILDSGNLLKSSIVDGVFAVAVGGSYVPETQQTRLGRAKNRNVAVVFQTPELPDVAFPEEVIWHLEKIPVYNVEIMPADQARTLLDGSIPSKFGEGDALDIPLHPSIVDKRTLERVRLKKESVSRFISDLQNQDRLRKLKTKNVR